MFSNGVEVQQLSVGFRYVAASSSILEWLCKLLALYILHGYQGRLYFLCYNASVCTSVMDNAVRGRCWVDRFAKVGSQLPVLSRILEVWLPARHDSHDTGCAAQWQSLSDKCATDRVRGSPDFHCSGLPLRACGLTL